MSIRFSSIPEHVKISIVQKLKLRDFVKFHETSLESYNVARKVKTRFYCFMNDICVSKENEDLHITSGRYKGFIDEKLKDVPISIGSRLKVNTELTAEVCEYLINFLAMSNSTFSEIDTSEISCSETQFNTLFSSAKIQSWTGFRLISNIYSKIPAVKNIHKISIICPVDDETLLSLNVPYLELEDTNISSYGINLLLKKLLNGEWKMKSIEIETTKEFQDYLIFNGIQYSTASYVQEFQIGDKDDRTFVLRVKPQLVCIYKFDPRCDAR